MSNRDVFLARVRQAAEQGRPYRVHVKPTPEDVGYVGVTEDLCQRFAAEVDAVGGQSYIVADMASAREALFRLLEEAGAKSAICWQHELLDRFGLAEALAMPGVVLHDHDSLSKLPADEQRALLLACDIGITSCDCAIAETGTLMMCSRPGQERVASLLPPMHVAIVERAQIVADLMDAFAMLGADVQIPNSKFQSLQASTNAKGQVTNDNLNSKSQIPNLPSNITFITGPSKTGDIELQLTTGVHGPGKWRVIVIQ